MTIFLDTANLEELRKAVVWGVCGGVTTNPKILLQEKGVDVDNHIEDIISIVGSVPISVELTQTDSRARMIGEAQSYADIATNIVVKVPMFGSGLGLELSKILLDMGIKVNMTCMISASQAILACELGVTYASLFYRRMADFASERLALGTMMTIRKFIEDTGSLTQIIAGSIRKKGDVPDCFLAGAHIVTVPPRILWQMPFHKRTEETIAEFDEAWREFQK